jgi:electron transfer flavoprotein alpha subunit
MSVLVFVEIDNGAIKKTSLEAVYYGAQVAASQGTTATAVAIGDISSDALAQAGAFGAQKVLHNATQTSNAMPCATVLAAAAQQEGAQVIIAAKSSLGDAVAARTAAKLGLPIVSNVSELPDFSSGFSVKKGIYTGKAFAQTTIAGNRAVLVVKKNAVTAVEGSAVAAVEAFAPAIADSDFAVKTLATHKASGDISLPEADLVVSAGRGLKGPENWAIVEDLAKALGAATACSKPVSDLDWRPHHEHVGQTGVKVAPNLYIAAGISGAIQHLAGVNSSKVIVVINKDPEAPFFKAADYGIVGDVFDVLPRLTKAVLAQK